MSNIHKSLLVWPSPYPPVTRSCGWAPPYPRHTAAWYCLPTGQGSPLPPSSWLQCCIKHNTTWRPVGELKSPVLKQGQKVSWPRSHRNALLLCQSNALHAQTNSLGSLIKSCYSGSTAEPAGEIWNVNCACNVHRLLTIAAMSSRYVLFNHLDPSHPPNSTARWSSIMVREKPSQGGGLVPLTSGEVHVPMRVWRNKSGKNDCAIRKNEWVWIHSHLANYQLILVGHKLTGLEASHIQNRIRNVFRGAE